MIIFVYYTAHRYYLPSIADSRPLQKTPRLPFILAHQPYNIVYIVYYTNCCCVDLPTCQRTLLCRVRSVVGVTADVETAIIILQLIEWPSAAAGVYKVQRLEFWFNVKFFPIALKRKICLGCQWLFKCT